MRAVVLELPDRWRAERERMPESHRDEMWSGVLHMSPPPNFTHQDFAGQLYFFLRMHWALPNGNQVVGEVGVSPPGEPDWRENYRVPDLTLFTPDRAGINRDSHLAGAPTVVVEIRSRGDETYEKLGFYAALGVPEVWVFDRDTKAVELHLLAAGGYAVQTPDVAGWYASPATGVAFRQERAGRIWARIGAAAEELPGA